jgi:hypothetical protein
MKKVISLLLLLAFGIALVSCGSVDIDADIQGEWIKEVEAQSGTQVTLLISNGTVKRTEIFGDVKTEITGVYTIDDKGCILIAYTDNTSQKLMAIATENGSVLRDNDTMTYYTKK